MTLAGLVPRGGDFNFYIDGEAQEYQILKRDIENNLALIKINRNDLKPCAFADFSEAKLGERVFLLGKVFLQRDIVTLTNQGIIKYFTKDFIRSNISEKTSLAGSSLFNIKGELLGLNTIDSENRVTAIPISIIRNFAGF